jgi:hypothetical protein
MSDEAQQIQQIEQTPTGSITTFDPAILNESPYSKVSMLDRSFWDLWIQKCLRNFASVKYQFMVFFFWLVVYGMFFEKNKDGDSFISPIEGLAFLGGGFMTLAVSRILLRTSLFEPKDPGSLDTDQ